MTDGGKKKPPRPPRASWEPPEPPEPEPAPPQPAAPQRATPIPPAAAAATYKTGPAASGTRPAPSDTRPAPSDTRPAASDTRPAPSDTRAAPSDTGAAPSDTGGAAPSDTGAAPSDTGGAAPSDTGAAASNDTAGEPSSDTGAVAPSDTGAVASYDTGAVASYDTGAVTASETGPVTASETGPGTSSETGPVAWSEIGPVSADEATSTAVASESTGAAAAASIGAPASSTSSASLASSTSAGRYPPPVASSSTASADDPLLPVTFSDRELREAAGVKPRPERDSSQSSRGRAGDDDGGDDLDGDGDGPRKSRKMLAVGAFTTVIGLGIAALVLLGRVNKATFVIACKPQEVVAEQGRAFPPWGTRALEDDEKWKPIKIPPEAECRERETEDESELSGWYLDMLVERATALLTVREVTDYAGASTILEQALLHARAPERRDQRKEIERLQGDVGYWRASAKLRDASAALTDAAKLFDTAATQRPRHVSDASAWATYARKLIDDLHAGPTGTKPTGFPPLPTTERPTAPTGSALPIEPEPAAGSGTTAGSDAPPATPPDAGVPTGGVLL